MTKEERAEKWFSNIPGAESISIERKIEICDKAAKRMMMIILGLLTLEFILLFVVGGEIFTKVADFLNRISEGGHTGLMQYRPVKGAIQSTALTEHKSNEGL